MMNPDMVDPDAYIADLEHRLREAELHGAALASQLSEKVDELDRLRNDQIARCKEAWEAGFRLCRAYGDNHIHFEGEQKARHWRRFLEGA